MDVRSAQTKFACAGFKDDAVSIEILELLSYLQSAVRGSVVDDDYFPFEFAGRARVSACCRGESLSKSLVRKARVYFSVKVRLSNHVTMKTCISMETSRER